MLYLLKSIKQVVVEKTFFTSTDQEKSFLSSLCHYNYYSLVINPHSDTVRIVKSKFQVAYWKTCWTCLQEKSRKLTLLHWITIFSSNSFKIRPFFKKGLITLNPILLDNCKKKNCKATTILWQPGYIENLQSPLEWYRSTRGERTVV